MRKLLSLITLLAIFVALFACKVESKQNFHILTGAAMGTTYRITYGLLKLSSQDSEKIDQAIKHVIDGVNQKMSTYLEHSELSKFNHSRVVKKAFYISADTAKVIQEAIRLHRLTEGALDVTAGPLVNLWGFGPDKKEPSIPNAATIAVVKKSVGMQLFTLSQDGKHRYYLSKLKPEVYLDLSSIAKGFAVDKVANYLDSQHIGNYLIEIGGEIRAKGLKNNHKPWQVAIEKPNWQGKREITQIVELTNNSIATSGSYRNYYQVGGQLYSHEIDPRSGYPSQSDILSISVIDPSNMTADGLATGLAVMSSKKALNCAESNGIPIFMTVRDGEGKTREVYSKDFLQFIGKK